MKDILYTLCRFVSPYPYTARIWQNSGTEIWDLPVPAEVLIGGNIGRLAFLLVKRPKVDINSFWMRSTDLVAVVNTG